MFEDIAPASLPSTRKTFTAPVDEAHPFDLDSYISNYSGRLAYQTWDAVNISYKGVLQLIGLSTSSLRVLQLLPRPFSLLYSTYINLATRISIKHWSLLMTISARAAWKFHRWIQNGLRRQCRRISQSG